MKRVFAVCVGLLSWHAMAQSVRTETLVAPLPSAAQILIPAAGSTAGANGTYFRSDITLHNFRDAAQRVELRWIPRAGTPAAAPVFVNIPGRSSLRSEDFVHDVLGLEGLGAIVAMGISADGEIDSSARLHATSRIWTPQPGLDGTTSQSLSTIRLSDATTAAASILGLRRGTQYRLNVGIVNLDPEHAQTFQVEVSRSLLSLPPEFYELVIPPLSMQQIALDATVQQPLTRIDVTNSTDSSARSNHWVAFGSSVDNVTGDAWSELAVPTEN